ncbi:MAG: 1-deoxy-D-xylulose-5-phosphate synthase [Candidatus Paraimprobicoccus trichonymphae]|uniref:1-deoxy-D-xylulose-5-phosphate synthase n=1 Tax=Candidatus Paraimprobicoccus trichonymphae TaxID=3033793 RepID=A0AA48HWV6_9FIRM|nr:MAG: 1-deoxy-D-xylulose-5-phosphate synthase [Candidatus Paraimprobicoccus trichonymphae]
MVNKKKICQEIRRRIIDVVSKNGGHLASNLGVVELTLVLHEIFNGKNDRIIWDVGHQCYAHKILTGRSEKLKDIRKENGISGFTNRFESEYDVFTAGHSSTSISSAFGLAQARKINSEPGYTIAIIGDGALTGGLAYEGLNNSGRFDKNFIVVLNDNEMSISKNVGSISNYLSKIRTRNLYIKFKNIVEKGLDSTPLIGNKLKKLLIKSKSAVKKFVYENTIFEEMGFLYYGPVDGHDLKELNTAFNIAKNINQPVFVHVVTTKGKGYKFAEKNPKNFHGIGSFEITTGNSKKTNENFSDVFGEELVRIAEKNPKICAITAAMKSGTGLNKFFDKFKDRFFDVGIAEEHAVTFASGLSVGGLIPVFAVNSSFLQRTYDQLIHDVSIQELKIILAIDRSGLIGNDGETHQGLFDISFLNTIPNVTIFCPSFFDELKYILNYSINSIENKIFAIRYPKGSELYRYDGYEYNKSNFDTHGDINNTEILLITYGRTFSFACEARKILLEKNIKICILKLNVVKPIDLKILEVIFNFKKIFFFEESLKSGGVAEKLGCILLENNYVGEYKIVAIDDRYVKHSSMKSQIEKYCLSTSGMVNKISEFENI